MNGIICHWMRVDLARDVLQTSPWPMHTWLARIVNDTNVRIMIMQQGTILILSSEDSSTLPFETAVEQLSQLLQGMDSLTGHSRRHWAVSASASAQGMLHNMRRSQSASWLSPRKWNLPFTTVINPNLKAIENLLEKTEHVLWCL